MTPGALEMQWKLAQVPALRRLCTLHPGSCEPPPPTPRTRFGVNGLFGNATSRIVASHDPHLFRNPQPTCLPEAWNPGATGSRRGIELGESWDGKGVTPWGGGVLPPRPLGCSRLGAVTWLRGPHGCVLYEPGMQQALNKCVTSIRLCSRCEWAAWKEVLDWLKAGE